MSVPGRRDGHLEAVIFDFDGVLADTVPLHRESYRDLFAEEGVEFTDEDYRRHGLGASRAQTIRAILGPDLEPERFRRLMRRKSEIVLERVRDEGLCLLPGSLELVRELHELGLKIGLASSSRNARVFLEILGIGFLFHSIRDTSEDLPSKPAPDLYLHAIRDLEVDSGAALAIEDSQLGVASALAAGLRVLGVEAGEKCASLEGVNWRVKSLEEVSASELVSWARS